ncbi:hypothetical protein ACOMHN_057376 [Nucella lapillus]
MNEMSNTKSEKQTYRCVHCGCQVSELYKDFKKGIIKISHCTKCNEVADKYIEYDSVIIFLDALLLHRPVYRHILVNSKLKRYWRFLLVLWLCDALTKLMQRKAGDPSPQLQPDYIFYSALEWHFYQDYLLSAAESLVFFCTVIGLLAGKHLLRNKNLKHFQCEAVVKALSVSSMGRLLVVPALIWGESYSALGVALTHLFVASSNMQALRVIWGESYSALGVALSHLFVASSNMQALRVVSKKTSSLQASLIVLCGYGAQNAMLMLVGFSFLGHYLSSSTSFPNATRLLDMYFCDVYVR